MKTSQTPTMRSAARAESAEPQRSRRAGGFTLIEMLLVLVILATLAAIVIPKFAGRSQQAKVTQAISQIGSFKLALDTFEVDNGYYPRDLNALVQPPSGVTASDWKGPYLEKGIPLDPWGNPYIYEYPGRRNLNGFDIMSMGPDGRSGGEDDITNWDVERR
jgi:general secretion pathway protein G